ncbi:hypothetical protein [Algibacter pectinivorans]|uniref:Uncharacterized protein n=1 Tax=Algibacter pectinivorans TaxID=870482 RepID=A0A1I1RYC8_9FLAO|nr:hypothetical protein [Algibacter pectinivorans]SFD35650.1 hypothetical protein SAMN04487987_110119 [Algibacter pectinivorans]
MIDFLTRNFNFISYALEFLAAFVGLLCFKKYRNTSTRYFIYFLVYIFFVEVIGAMLVYAPFFLPIQLLRKAGVRVNNWYNVLWLFGSIVCVVFYFHAIINRKKLKLVIRVVGVLFIAVMLSHFVFYYDVFLNSRSTFYQIAGLITTVVCITTYFIELTNSNAILNMFKMFSFYASVGLFLWWLIITPVIFFDIYNTEYDRDFVNLKRLIFLFANIFMYSCFILGLIISKPNNA